jgi:hypothetical protein
MVEGNMKNPFRDVDVERALGLLGLSLALLLVRLANRGYGEHVTYADHLSGFLARRGIDAIGVIGWLVDRLPQPVHSEPRHEEAAGVRVWVGRV